MSSAAAVAALNLSEDIRAYSINNNEYYYQKSASIMSASMSSTNNVTNSVDLMMNATNELSIYWKFSNAYRPIHGWLATFVCLFGIPSNLLNIIVLTRPNMITSPTNLILTALAFSDLFTMLSSIVFSIFFYIVHMNTPFNEPSLERDSWGWTHFAMLHVMASVTFHSISIWLTVYLACFRYIYLASSSSAVCGAIHATSASTAYQRSHRSTCSSISSVLTNSVQPPSRRTTSPHMAGRLSSSLTNARVNTRERVHSVRRRAAYVLQRCLLQCRTYNCTLVGIVHICIFCVLFCVPAYMYPKVKDIVYSNESYVELTQLLVLNKTTGINELTYVNRTGYRPLYYYNVQQSYLNEITNNTVFKITFYSQAILGKFIPCILLVTFSSLLIHSLVVINRNNKRLNRTSANPKKRGSSASKPTILQRVLAALRIKKPSSASLNEANRQRANSNHSNHQRPPYQRQATTSSLNNGVVTGVGGGGANGSGNGGGSGNSNGNVNGGEATKKTVSLQVPEKSAQAQQQQSGGGLVIDPPSSISSHATGASAVLPGATTGGNVTPATPETANRANDAASNVAPAGTGGNSPQTPSITPRCGSDAPRTPKFFPPARVSSLGSNLNRNLVPGGGDLDDDDSPTANRRPPSPRPLTASPKLSNHYSIPNDNKNVKRQLKPVPNTTVVKPKRNKAKENLRTTLMLIIVCILFLITEFPQAILMLFSIIYGEPLKSDSFYNRVYTPLGDLTDMLALINNSINFLLYCTMSRAFRNTFYQLIMRIRCCAWLLLPCLPREAREAQAQAKSKRQGRKAALAAAAAAAAAAAKGITNGTNNIDKELSNNLNAMINSNNFSIFTGNTGIQNVAKEVENNTNSSQTGAAKQTSNTNINNTTSNLLTSDNIELKPLIKSSSDEKNEN